MGWFHHMLEMVLTISMQKRLQDSPQGLVIYFPFKTFIDIKTHLASSALTTAPRWLRTSIKEFKFWIFRVVPLGLESEYWEQNDTTGSGIIGIGL